VVRVVDRQGQPMLSTRLHADERVENRAASATISGALHDLPPRGRVEKAFAALV
jgi:hypothetical protein